MAMEAMSMSTITDRIEIQLDAGSDEVTLTRAEAVEVAARLHRQAAKPERTEPTGEACRMTSPTDTVQQLHELPDLTRRKQS